MSWDRNDLIDRAAAAESESQAIQHSLDKCERRLEAAERELAAYENLRAALEVLYSLHRGHIASPCPACTQAEEALAALDRLDQEKP